MVVVIAEVEQFSIPIEYLLCLVGLMIGGFGFWVYLKYFRQK